MSKSQNLTVCITLAFSFPGETGTPLHAMGIVRKLHEKGLKVHVVQFRVRPFNQIASDIWEGVPVYRVGFPLWQPFLAQLITKEKINIVHAQHVDGAVTSLLPTLVMRIPLIYEVHSFWIAETNVLQGKKGFRFYRNILGERLVFRMAKCLIVYSDKMREHFASRFGISRKKMHLIYPGVNVNQFKLGDVKPIRISGIYQDDLVVMYAGNFWPWQGIDLLLNAVPKVLEVVKNVKFVLVGGKDEHVAEKKQQVERLGLQDHVIFTGQQPYDLMPCYFSTADVLVIPRPDSMVNWTTSRKLGEYLSAGKPIVATDVADHRSIIETNGCGIVCDCSPLALADALRRVLMLDKAIRKNMGQKAHATLERLFDWDAQIIQLFDLYGSLVK